MTDHIEDIHGLNRIDELAIDYSATKKWGMGAFIAVFDISMEKVLLVKTGLYAKNNSGDTPWNLPGGAVEPGEQPCHAAIRELAEETGLSKPTDLCVAAWITRPYYKSRYRSTAGELILVYAGIDITCAAGLRPAPPEIIACDFFPFNREELLQIPEVGKEAHSPMPLPRHWVYWISMARIMLKNPGSSIFTHEYPNAASMAVIPDALKTRS